MAEFFEKATDSLNKSFKTLASKSKDFLEITKLKSEIRNTEEVIQKKFQTLGKKAFELISKQAFSEEALKEDYREITAFYKKTTELEEAIKKVEQEALKMRHGNDAIICAKCGATNKSGDKFCMNCGSAMAIEDKPESKACPTCGISIKEGSKFCSRCGTSLI